MSTETKHTTESAGFLANSVGEVISAVLPDGLGYAVILTDTSTGLVAMLNTNLRPAKLVAQLLRETADELERIS